MIGIESIGFPLFHSAVRLLVMLFRFVLALPPFGLMRMTRANRMSSFYAVLLVGTPMIL